jgi:phage FluMu protein Com
MANEKAYIKVQCPHCKKEKLIEVNRDGYEKWKSGALVQEAFPDLPAAEREMLISGICPECWNKMFNQ